MSKRRIFAGERLKSLRGSRGLKQAEMAARLGISVSYLSQLEHDDRPLTAPLLAPIELERAWWKNHRVAAGLLGIFFRRWHIIVRNALGPNAVDRQHDEDNGGTNLKWPAKQGHACTAKRA